MNKRSRKTLRRIKWNDSKLTTLMIGHEPDEFEGGIFNSCKFDNFSKLGKAIGKNTHIKTIHIVVDRFHYVIAHSGLDSINSAFFNGLKQNSSISHLIIGSCNHYSHHYHGHAAHEILRVYQQNNNLTHLGMYAASHILQNGGEVVLAATLRHCTNLKKISLAENNITDEQLVPMVEAMRGLHSLEYLDLGYNRIGNAGCEALSALLDDSNSSLTYLDLPNNQINDEGATIIINSLANNTKLRKFILFNNSTTDSIIRHSFSRLLCNTSDINSIYSSNHTLVTLILDHWIVESDPDLMHLLQMNQLCGREYNVAKTKILRFLSDIDMSPLFEWDKNSEWSLKALPYVVSWFDKAETNLYVDSRDKEIRRKKLYSIYQFALAMPLLLLQGANNKGETTVKVSPQRVEMESMNRADNCCVIL